MIARQFISRLRGIRFGIHPVAGKLLIWSASGIAALLLILFAFRGVIIRGYADKKIASVKEKYGLAIRYDRLKPSGLAGVELDGLSVVPACGDTLFSVRRLRVGLNPWKLLMMEFDLKRFDADAMRLSFIKRDSLHSNFDFLYRFNNGETAQTAVRKRNYARQADRLERVLFDLMPARAELRDLSVEYLNRGDSLEVTVPSLVVKNHRFDTRIQTVENGDTSRWAVAGTLHDSDRKIEARLCAADGGKVRLPFLEYRWGARVAFDTLSFALRADGIRSGVAPLKGGASVSGLTLYHKRISPDEVVLDRGEIDYKILVGENYTELDSSTTVRFNRLDFHPYLRVEHGGDWRLTASVNKEHFAADDLFASLPKGLFYNLEGIKTEGNLSYRFLLDADFALLDSLRFESDMHSEGFRIISFGNTDLRRMNGPFTYTAYENGEAVRTFPVGEENPNFRPLESISPLLRMAVMQSEDGEFFWHNGFLLDAMRSAMVQDIRARRFVRGGSTISMQLVKNVFLNRNKTIARKLEEALIVWLIESQRLSSKQRMYEVYLNIAEWGPGIYGAREASRYYFDKEPDQLDVEEAIFLAGLIPHPKRALSSFDDDLSLKPYHEGYFRLLARRLEVKGEISPERAEAVVPQVTVRGAAREALLRRAEERAAGMTVDSLVLQVTAPDDGE